MSVLSVCVCIRRGSSTRDKSLGIQMSTVARRASPEVRRRPSVSGRQVTGAPLNAAHDRVDRHERRVRFGDDVRLPLAAVGPLEHEAVARRVDDVARIAIGEVGTLERNRRDDGDAALDAGLA